MKKLIDLKLIGSSDLDNRYLLLLWEKKKRFSSFCQEDYSLKYGVFLTKGKALPLQQQISPTLHPPHPQAPLHLTPIPVLQQPHLSTMYPLNKTFQTRSGNFILTRLDFISSSKSNQGSFNHGHKTAPPFIKLGITNSK